MGFLDGQPSGSLYTDPDNPVGGPFKNPPLGTRGHNFILEAMNRIGAKDPSQPALVDRPPMFSSHYSGLYPEPEIGPITPEVETAAGGTSKTKPKTEVKANTEAKPTTSKAKPIDAEPSGEAPKTDTGKWSTAASQAMIAAGLALMKSSGKTYTNRHEATMSGLTNVAEAAGAANQTYQGIKVAESESAAKRAEEKSKADLRSAQTDAARGGMRTHEQDIELQKLKNRATGHSEAYNAALASDKVQDNQRKNMDAIEKNAYNKAKAAFIAKPGIVWTNDGQLDMSGLNSPDTIKQFFEAVKKETVAGARTRRSLIGETLYSAILEEAGTTGDPQPQKPMTATNPKTGQKITSLDGGKTWQ